MAGCDPLSHGGSSKRAAHSLYQRGIGAGGLSSTPGVDIKEIQMRRLIVAALAVVTVAGCGSSSEPTTTLNGHAILTRGYTFQSGTGSIKPTDLSANSDPTKLLCRGDGLFADLTPGSTVSMLDGSGTVIATGAVDAWDGNSIAQADKIACSMSFTIEHAPANVSGAQLRFGQHPPVALAADYSTATVALTLVQ